MGRAALVAPDGVSSVGAEHVVIGWKDTREARRAVQDALPFLREATTGHDIRSLRTRRGEDSTGAP